MNKRKIFITITGLFVLCAGLFAKDDTYIYDYWGEIERSPDVYRVSHVLYADNLKLDESLRNPAGLFCKNNMVYVVDTDNNRIIELNYGEKKQVELVRVIDSFNAPEGVINTFASPTDIFINDKGDFYIADTNNGRVVIIDKDMNLVNILYEPSDPTYEKEKEFLPQRVVADSKGRTYVLAKNVNKGFIKYEYDGSFTGFYGASEVIYDWTTYIWKKIATRAQREQMESFVPTEYSNCYIDNEGFIYAVTKVFDEWDLKSGSAKPIRRLNALGKDILVKNGVYLPIGDVQWSNAAGIKDPSKFTDITVLDNEVYIAVDESRGRIFAYDNQGSLLFAFGNRGNIDGYFRQPSAIDHIGKDLFVLDSMNASITVFTPTEYGNLIYTATEQYGEGLYDESAETWEKVLKINGNYDLAYVGIGKAYLRQNRNKEAMECFKIKYRRRLYSKAFMYYRKEWIEKNGGKCLLVLLALILIPLIIRRVKAFKRELESL